MTFLASSAASASLASASSRACGSVSTSSVAASPILSPRRRTSFRRPLRVRAAGSGGDGAQRDDERSYRRGPPGAERDAYRRPEQYEYDYAPPRDGWAETAGAPVDKAQAAELFQRAAERGHSRAAANLANLGADPQ